MESSMLNQFRIITFAIVVGVCCGFSTQLFAQSEGFQDYLDAAKTAYDKEDYEEAIRNLLLANSVENNARLLFNIAKSYQKLEYCDKAIVYFMAFRREPTAGAELRAQALAEIKKSRSCQNVKPLAGRFFIKSDPIGARVSIDGGYVGVTPLEVAGYKSGSHNITFTLDGYNQSSRTVETLPGNDLLITEKLVSSSSGGVQDDVEPEQGDVEGEESASVVPMIIAGGLTAVGVGVLSYGIYTDVVTIVDLKDERSKLDLNTADGVEKSGTLTEDIDGAITTSLVSYIIGGTLLAGGVGYFAYSQFFDTDENTVVISPVVNQEGYGLSFSSTF